MTQGQVHPIDVPTPGGRAESSGLRVEVIDDLAGLAALRREWQTLYDTIAGGIPFTTYEWTAMWWAHLRRNSRWTRDDLRVFVVRRGGRLIAVAPMILTSRLILRIPVNRELQPIGADPNITEVRAVLVAADDELAALKAVLTHARTAVPHETLQFGGVGASSAAAAYLRALPRAEELPPTSMFVVRLPATWEELHAALPRNIRESLRKCRNSLTRDSLTPAFHVLTDVNAIRSSLPAFFDLHRNRALATDTVHHNDVFRRPEDRAFLAGVVDHLAPGGMVRMFQMEIGGKIVAMRLGIACHESLYLYYSGYDTAWAKYSVMTSVNAYAIQYAISMGFRTVNLSTGSDQAKLRWRPEEIPTISVRIHRRTLRTMGTQRALDFARAFRSRVRSARASTG